MVKKSIKLTVITYNFNEDMNLFFYKKYMPKPKFITKILQLIDKTPDKVKDWPCPTNCSTAACYCRNTNPVTRYVCYRFYT